MSQKKIVIKPENFSTFSRALDYLIADLMRYPKEEKLSKLYNSKAQ